MERIIIWGCGIVGQRIYRTLKKYWTSTYQIVGFGDNNAAIRNRYKSGENIFQNLEIDSDIKGIFSMEEIVEKYMNREFDAIIIGTSDKYKIEIREALRTLKIPVIDFPRQKMITVLNTLSERVNIGKDYFHIYKFDEVYVRFDYKTHLMVVYDQDLCAYQESVNFQENIWRIREFPKKLSTMNVDKEYENICILQQDYTNNYAHFTFDVLSKIVGTSKCGFEGRYILLESDDARHLIDLLGIQDRIIWINEKNDDHIYRIKAAWMVEPECGETPHMASWVHMCANEVIKQMKKSDKEVIVSQKRIYVKRIGTRKSILDEKVLQKFGFEIVIPEELTLEQEIDLFHSASIIIAPHGSALANLIYMKKNATLIELVSDSFFSSWLMNVINAMEIRYQLIVGKAIEKYEGDIRNPSIEDFRIDNSMLELAIQTAIERENG